MTGKKVFISYRRDTGSAMARMIFDKLKQENYACFLDVDTLRAGDFHQRILAEIDLP